MGVESERTFLPDVLDGDGALMPRKTNDVLYLLTRELRRLAKRVDDVAVSSSITVTGAAGVVFVDVTLTANHSVVAPSVPDDSIVIYSFTQDATGGWTVTWPVQFVGAHPPVNPTANWVTTIFWRKIAGPEFRPLREQGSFLP